MDEDDEEDPGGFSQSQDAPVDYERPDVYFHVCGSFSMHRQWMLRRMRFSPEAEPARSGDVEKLVYRNLVLDDWPPSDIDTSDAWLEEEQKNTFPWRFVFIGIIAFFLGAMIATLL